jgi:branched-chain amino acid transport system ATP-binding protein
MSEAQHRRIGESVLKVDNISLRFGGVRAITGVSFDIKQGEIFSIIGPNGAGKTSMLNVINGFYHPQEGTITYKGTVRRRMRPHEAAATGIARTFQNVALFRGMTTLDNIMTGRLLRMHGPATRAVKRLGAAGLPFRPIAAGIDFIFDMAFWGPAQREEIRHREVVEKIIDFLEIQAIRKVPVGRLPYGLQKRVELGRALAMEPDLLLLDEPMAGMNVEEKEDMCRFILDVNEEFGTTIALIEHDMSVVMDISDRVAVLDYGRKIAEGAPEAVRTDPAVIDAYLGVAHQ